MSTPESLGSTPANGDATDSAPLVPDTSLGAGVGVVP